MNWCKYYSDPGAHWLHSDAIRHAVLHHPTARFRRRLLTSDLMWNVDVTTWQRRELGSYIHNENINALMPHQPILWLYLFIYSFIVFYCLFLSLTQQSVTSTTGINMKSLGFVIWSWWLWGKKQENKWT